MYHYNIEILYNRVGTVAFTATIYDNVYDMHARPSGARSSDEETRTII
jgi:hypothetical protein